MCASQSTELATSIKVLNLSESKGHGGGDNFFDVLHYYLLCCYKARVSVKHIPFYTLSFLLGTDNMAEWRAEVSVNLEDPTRTQVRPRE